MPHNIFLGCLTRNITKELINSPFFFFEKDRVFLAEHQQVYHPPENLPHPVDLEPKLGDLMSPIVKYKKGAQRGSRKQLLSLAISVFEVPNRNSTHSIETIFQAEFWAYNVKHTIT